ncbi:MAG TPA: hypothetical protein VIH85_00860 [Solirubrobacteraceae bacterium]
MHRTRDVRALRACLVAAALAALGTLGFASGAGEADAARPLLPAPLTITAGGTTLLMSRDGELRRVQPSPHSFPRDAGLFELLGGSTLTVLNSDGSLFATVRLPRDRSGIEAPDSPLALSPDGRTVAFSAPYLLRAASPDPARGAIDLETVYLLRAGARTAVPIHSQRVDFAPCMGGANVAWHGRWLLFSAGEGSLSVIDTARAHDVLDFTAATRNLPGVGSGFGAEWGGRG